MSFFAIPDLTACLQRTRASFRSYLSGTDAWLPVNNVGPTAKVLGGSASEIYQRLDYVGRQAFVLYAEGKYLEDHGADYDIYRRDAAPASGKLLLSAGDALAVANGAQFVRSDGVVAVASSAVTLAGSGTASVPVVTGTKALSSNSQPGTPFTIRSGVSGPGLVSATVVADAAGLSGGLDVEPDGLPRTNDLGTLRGRILFRKRNPPQGGAPADYVQWATAVPGVTRVFVERLYRGRGSVRVFPIFDVLFASTGGIADAAHIALVQEAIAAVAPSSALVTVKAPTAQVIPITVTGLTPYSTAIKAAVVAELADTFQRLGQVAGIDTPFPNLPFLATPFSFSALWIDQAVANATGSRRAVIAAPTADVPIATGSLPVFSPTGALNLLP